MVTPVRLGSSSRPATVAIGGSSGVRSTAPVVVSRAAPVVSAPAPRVTTVTSVTAPAVRPVSSLRPGTSQGFEPVQQAASSAQIQQMTTSVKTIGTPPSSIKSVSPVTSKATSTTFQVVQQSPAASPGSAIAALQEQVSKVPATPSVTSIKSVGSVVSTPETIVMQGSPEAMNILSGYQRELAAKIAQDANKLPSPIVSELTLHVKSDTQEAIQRKAFAAQVQNLGSVEYKQQAVQKYLDEHYPEHRSDGLNSKVSSLMPDVVIQSLAYGWDYNKIAESVGVMDSFASGKSNGSGQFGQGLTRRTTSQDFNKPFSDLSITEQQERIMMLNQGVSDEGLPPALGTYLTAALISTAGDDSRVSSLTGWVDGGQMKEAMTGGVFPLGRGNAASYLKTQEGQMVAGSVFGVASVVGGFAVGGPAGAVVAAGMFPFATTEWANLMSMNQFGQKSAKQTSGEWAPDQSYQYDQNYKSTNDLLTDLKFKVKDLTPEERVKRLQDAESSYNSLLSTFQDKYVYLGATKTLQDEINRLNDMEKTVHNLRSAISPTGELSGATLPETSVSVMIPKGYDVEIGGQKHQVSGDRIDLKGQPFDSKTIQLINKETGESKTVDVTFPESGTQTKDLRSDVSFATQYKQTREAIAKIKDEEKASKPGIAGLPSGMGQLAFKPEPGQTWFLDNEQIDTERLSGGAVLAPGYHAVEVQQEGKMPFQKTVFVGADQSVSLIPELQDDWGAKKRDKDIFGNEIDGGGGGGGGSSWSPSPAQTEAFIVFTGTVSGSQVFLDDQEIVPVLGTSYSISPGYHGVKLVKPGKLNWVKTVSVFAGDTVTISPQFEDAPPESTGDLKSVPINANPQGAKISINSVFTGQYTPATIQLAQGLYHLNLYKSGYDDVNTALWVGNTTAVGDNALALARLNGVDISGF